MYTSGNACRAAHKELSWQGPSFQEITRVSGNSEDPGLPARMLAVFYRQASDFAVQQVLVAVTQAYQSPIHLAETFEGWTFDGAHRVHGSICYHGAGMRWQTHISLELTPIAVPAPLAIPAARQADDSLARADVPQRHLAAVS